MTELWGWYGPMDFEALTHKIEALCAYELAAGSAFGFSLPHDALFSTHAQNAERARAIYASSVDGVRALHEAGLDGFAQAIETHNYDHLIF